MKKQFPFFALLFLLAGCKSVPEIFSVNNFTMTDSAGRAAAGVKTMPVPDIAGNWMGMEHAIKIEATVSTINGLPTYSLGLIDTTHGRDSGSTSYEVDFIKAGGAPYIEVVSWGMNRDEHDFNLVISTYARLNKLTRDTIIIQMMNSSFTQGWLKARGYKYFITADEKSNKEPAIYLTEDLPRLGKLLKEIYRETRAFKEADTLVRKKGGF
jgi:hypothetical protein